MPVLPQVTETALREMARDASSQFLNEGVSPTDAVVKVASAFAQPLTTEHVRRVCEMTYHDIFERSFQGATGDHRVVDFEPPDATKVAAAIRATHVQTHKDKVASAAASGGEMDKAASAPFPVVWQPPQLENPFAKAMAQHAPSGELERMMAHSILKEASSDVREAERALRAKIGSIGAAASDAYRALYEQAYHETARLQVPALNMLSACEHFMKTAGTADEIAVGVLADLIVDLGKAGVETSKTASATADVTPNLAHPLFSRVAKVAQLRSQRVHHEIALEEIINDGSRVNRELSRLFS